MDLIETLAAPIRVSLDVTTACDLACRHCRHGTLNMPRSALSSSEVRQVIDDAAGMNVFRLTISGGEPMLRSDIIDIVLYALKSKVGRVFLSTNGQHLERYDLGPLLPHRDRLTFKISLDGPPATHDGLRGQQGACVRARQAIAVLVASGFEVQVTTTLMRENLASIDTLVAWSAKAGCARHNLVEVVPVGRAGADMVLTPDERQEALQKVRSAWARHSRRGFTVVAKLPFAENAGFGLRCAGGTEECGILADGSVVGCRLMPDLVEGNIRKSSLQAIWSAPNAFALFRRLQPSDLLSPCRTCTHGASCLGGCHAFARAVRGSFFAPDTRCRRFAAPASIGDDAPCSAML